MDNKQCNVDNTTQNRMEFEEDSDLLECDPFQKIMEQIGSNGRFQLIYQLIFATGLACCGSMIYLNLILALNMPDHWCTVPGRENTTFSLEQWRQVTLPIQKDNRGTYKHSKCEMYNVDFTQIDNWHNWNATMQQQANVTACQFGWSYDDTWYDSTIPTEENWVCDNDLYITNIFVVARITEVMGSFVLGQMGDIFGRRIVYYMSAVSVAISRSVSIMTTRWYIWFLVFTSIAGFCVNAVFQSPQIVAMEISRESDRSRIAMYQSFGWSFGTTIVPLLFWWLRDWRIFMWLTTLPLVVVLAFSKYVIESPRWLINKRRFGSAILQFKKIAKINGRTFDMSEKELAKLYENQQTETTFGIASLFSGWRLARNTSIMGFSWCVVACSYFTLILFSAQMGGNPFLNLLLQNIVEIPAYCVAKLVGDRLGRRFTNTVSFFISFLICIPAFFIAQDPEMQWLLQALTTSIKFLNALSFYTISLQGMEIYPTCMRQTGISFGTILANTTGICAPYLVYLATTTDIRGPFYILSLMFFLGSICAFFLPETLHKKLPDSMEEARQFGRYDKWFSLPTPPHKLKTKQMDEAAENLNQPEYAP